MLLENSLYSTPAEREALVKDKKRVMDALCFSFLGFLGCYQLAQNRGALKTYQQTEGQLRLNAISDTNHDVSLSIKLAEEAHAIPTAAAQNVTKLLYKIKSKQIKGSLDENLIRDVLKTLKIGSNRPDTMVFAVVSQFEDGTLTLGQVAHKLYNLSKLPNFKTVSGEFRVLVMKGQYQELFAKLPKPSTQPAAAPSAPVAAPTITHVAPVVAPPAPAPVQNPMSIQSGGFQNVPDSILEPLFKDLINEYEWTQAVMRDNVIRFCKKNKIAIDFQLPQAAVSAASASLQRYMVTQWENKNYTWGGHNTRFPKWMDASNWSPYVPTIKRIMFMNQYMMHRHLIEEGKLIEFNTAMKISSIPNMGQVYFFDDWNAAFLNRMIEPNTFWSYIEQSNQDYRLATFDRICTIIYAASGGGEKRGLPMPMISLNPETWTVLTMCRRQGSYFMAKRAFASGYDNMNLSQLFLKAFDLENSNVTAKMPQSGSNVLVTTNISYFKKDPRLYKAAEILEKTRYVQFVDITDAFTTMTDQARKWAASAGDLRGGFWEAMASICHDSFGNRDVLGTEKFIEWTADEIHSGKLRFNLFSAKPEPEYSPEASQYYWNVFVEYAGKYPANITFTLWSAVSYWMKRNAQYVKDPDFVKELDSIFNNAYRHFKDEDVVQAITSGVQYTDATYVITKLAQLVKDGKWKLPKLPLTAWTQLISSGPKTDLFYNMWDFDEEIAEKLYSSYQSSGCRDELLRRYPGLRAKKFEAWYNRFNPKGDEANDNKPWVEAFRTFLREYSGWAMTSPDLLPKKISDFVLECIPHIADKQVLYTELSSGGHGLPEWIDKPVREVLHAAIHTRPVSLTTIGNARRLLDQKSFNDYVTKGSIQEFAAGVVVNGASTATTLCDILDHIAHNPSQYTVQVLLRFAYAMHKNVKEIREAGTAQYANAAYESVCEALNSLMASGKVAEVDQVYDALSFAPDLRTKILDWFRKSAVLRNALESVKEDEVHALITVDQKRMNQLMKFNNIKFPATVRKTKDTKLSDIIKTHTTFDLEPLAIKEDTLDEQGLKRRTAEYDAFNKYKHGNIGVKFLKSFHVSIPSQVEANKVWDDAHPTAERMDPVFHGTGSVAATFVLRYGFAVLSASDKSVVGRMLGNGIYFSNVLDKCGQYVSDGGYTRGKGTKGYIFQMKANLGHRDVDYKSSFSTVSPEWCVFHPNDQLNIYKAHFVELVDKSVVDNIKSEVNLNENFFKVEQFKDHLNEDLQNPVKKGCISYTFIDGQIPISTDMVIDFEQFDPTAFGPHVTMEPSGLGPVIYIEVDDPEVNEIYAIRYAVQFMAQDPDFQRFLDLLARRADK